jgi:hypothetical protein
MFNLYYDLDRPGDAEKPVLKSSFAVLTEFLERCLRQDVTAASEAGRWP